MSPLSVPPSGPLSMGDATEETRLIEKYYGNNEQPTAQELDRISFFASGPRKDMAAIDVEIEALESRLEILRSSRSRLEASISKHKSIKSIVRRLPDDVLGEIFIRCLPRDRYPAIYVREAPLLLTLISRRWRDVALRTPVLWAAAHTAIREFETYARTGSSASPAEIEAEEERQRAMMELFFSRAGDLPLSLSVYCIPSYSDYQYISPTWQWVTTTLFPRVQSLKLSGTSPPGNKFLWMVPVERFARLRSIKFEYFRTPGGQDNNLSDCTLFLAPGLREVNLRYGGLDPSQLPLQWGKLTRLILQGNNRPLFLETAVLLLRQCTGLTHCAIPVSGTCYSSDSTPSSNPPVAIEDRTISLPFLETLDLWHSCLIEELTCQLHVPRIQALRLIYEEDFATHAARPHESTTLPTFITYHPYCLSSILKLDMTFTHCSQAAIVGALQSLPNLRHLVVTISPQGQQPREDYGFQEVLLRLMTPMMRIVGADSDMPPPGTSFIDCLCPLLERLELLEQEVWLSNNAITLDALIPFISEKWAFAKQFSGVVARLSHLTVPAQTMSLSPTSPNHKVKVKRALRRCRKEMGLILKIENPYISSGRRAEQLEGLEDAHEWLNEHAGFMNG